VCVCVYVYVCVCLFVCVCACNLQLGINFPEDGHYYIIKQHYYMTYLSPRLYIVNI
jgi:hypothetical protein